MKTKQLLICAAVFIASLVSNTVFAGKGGGDSFEEGKMIITVGYGFPNLGKSALKKTFADYTDLKISGVGPASVKFEYALSDKIGLGLSVNYTSFKVEYISSDVTSSSTWSAGLILNR